MEKDKKYKAIIITQGDKYEVVEGDFLATEKEGNIHLLGNESEDDLIRLIYASTFYITKAIYVGGNITAFKAMDICLSYAYSIIALIEDELKKEDIQLPFIQDDIEEVQANSAVGVSKEKIDGYIYSSDLKLEKFFKTIIYSCGLLLVNKYNQTIDDIWEYVENGIETFKEKNVPEDEKEKAVIATTVGFGKRVEIEGKVASVLTSPNTSVGIIGDTYKYNLGDLGIGTLSGIGCIYLDRGMPMDRIEAALKEIYEQAIDMVRDRAEGKKSSIKLKVNDSEAFV